MSLQFWYSSNFYTFWFFTSAVNTRMKMHWPIFAFIFSVFELGIYENDINMKDNIQYWVVLLLINIEWVLIINQSTRIV